VFLVAAEGGGIRSAYVTAEFLTELQAADPLFKDHLFAITQLKISLGKLYEGCAPQRAPVGPLSPYIKSYIALVKEQGFAPPAAARCFVRHGAHVHCEGKGRNERRTPLARSTAAVLNAWIEEQGVTTRNEK
jgi:hypothetical protein